MYTILSSISIRWQVRAFAVLNFYWPNDFCIGGNDRLETVRAFAVLQFYWSSEKTEI